MPAVAVCDEQRRANKTKAFNRWVKGQLAEHDASQEELAIKMDITQQALSYKIRSGAAFTYPQMLIIFEFFGTTDEVILRFMRM